VFTVFCETLEKTDSMTMTDALRAKIIQSPTLRPRPTTDEEDKDAEREEVSNAITEGRTPLEALRLEQGEYRIRMAYFRSQFRFVNALTRISTMVRDMWLRTKEEKNEALRYSLKKLGDSMDWLKGVCLLYLSPCGAPYRVVRIPPELSFCLNSRDRVSL
jgi:hypothetical protein